jgi:hypothetical protein
MCKQNVAGKMPHDHGDAGLNLVPAFAANLLLPAGLIRRSFHSG